MVAAAPEPVWPEVQGLAGVTDPRLVALAVTHEARDRGPTPPTAEPRASSVTSGPRGDAPSPPRARRRDAQPQEDAHEEPREA
jgi:hypothetical protein